MLSPVAGGTIWKVVEMLGSRAFLEKVDRGRHAFEGYTCSLSLPVLSASFLPGAEGPPPLPTPAAMMFCPRAWGQETIKPSETMNQNKSFLLNLFFRYFGHSYTKVSSTTHH
jgi:hypothetical protein